MFLKVLAIADYGFYFSYWVSNRKIYLFSKIFGFKLIMKLLAKENVFSIFKEKLKTSKTVSLKLLTWKFINQFVNQILNLFFSWYELSIKIDF